MKSVKFRIHQLIQRLADNLMVMVALVFVSLKIEVYPTKKFKLL